MSESPTGTIDQIRFTGQACAICMASTSLMTTQVKGKTISEALGLKQVFIDFLTKETAPANWPWQSAGSRRREKISAKIEVRDPGMACLGRGFEEPCSMKVHRTLVVTGGSRGIGAAVARLAGSRGYSVAVNFLGNEAPPGASWKRSVRRAAPRSRFAATSPWRLTLSACFSKPSKSLGQFADSSTMPASRGGFRVWRHWKPQA